MRKTLSQILKIIGFSYETIPQATICKYQPCRVYFLMTLNYQTTTNIHTFKLNPHLFHFDWTNEVCNILYQSTSTAVSRTHHVNAWNTTTQNTHYFTVVFLQFQTEVILKQNYCALKFLLICYVKRLKTFHDSDTPKFWINEYHINDVITYSMY